MIQVAKKTYKNKKHNLSMSVLGPNTNDTQNKKTKKQI